MKIALLVLLLAGCMTAPITPEQISAMKDGTAMCASGTGLWGTVKVVLAKLSQGTTEGGNVVVGSNNCDTTIVSNAAVVAAARAAAAAAAQASKQ